MIEALRKRKGLSRDDDTEDRQILKMTPYQIIKECFVYFLGHVIQTAIIETRQEEVIAIFNVRGTTFEGRKEKLLGLLGKSDTLECSAYLIPEPNNPHDSNAIRIHTCKPDIHIGYVPKEICKILLYGFTKRTITEYGHKIVIQRGTNNEKEEIIWIEFYLQEADDSRKKLERGF